MEKVRHAPLLHDARNVGKCVSHVGVAVSHGSGDHRLCEVEFIQNLFSPQLHEHACPLRVDSDRRLEQLGRERESLDVVVLSESRIGRKGAKSAYADKVNGSDTENQADDLSHIFSFTRVVTAACHQQSWSE